MLKEILGTGQNPDKLRPTAEEVKFPQAEDIFSWSKANPSIISDSAKAPDEIDLNLGFPSRFGGTWGGDGKMIRYIEFNPYFHGRRSSIVVSEDEKPGEKIIKLTKKQVKARVLLGNPDGDEFGVRYNLTDDGKWYREAGRLTRYGENETAWYPQGRNKEIKDIFSRDHIEDIVKREGSVYTKKRA